MKKSALFLIVLTSIFFTSTIYLLFLNFHKPTLVDISHSVPTSNIFPTQNEAPKSTTLAYSNTKFGFSFEYDASEHFLDKITNDYQYSNLKVQPETFILWKGLKPVDLPEESKTMHFNPAIMFSIKVFSDSISPEEFAKRLCGSEYGPDYLKLSGFKKNYTKGQVFYSFNSGGIGNGTYHHVFFNHDTIVSFNTAEPSITYETNPEFAQILSSFKFISSISQKEPAVIPTGWKSGRYESESVYQNSFAISYPSDWYFGKVGPIFSAYDPTDPNIKNPGLPPTETKCDVVSALSTSDFSDLTNILDIANETDKSYKIIRGESVDILWGQPIITYILSSGDTNIGGVYCYAFSDSNAKTVDEIVKTIRF